MSENTKVERQLAEEADARTPGWDAPRNEDDYYDDKAVEAAIETQYELGYMKNHSFYD